MGLIIGGECAHSLFLRPGDYTGPLADQLGRSSAPTPYGKFSLTKAAYAPIPLTSRKYPHIERPPVGVSFPERYMLTVSN